MSTTSTTRLTEKSASVQAASASLIPVAPALQDSTHLSAALAPPVLAKGKGAMVTDVEGKVYIDFVAAGGSLVLGHADEQVVVAIHKAASKGLELGSPTEAEVRLAEQLAGRFTSIEAMRFMRSPMEAALAAVALARHRTGRSQIITMDPRPTACWGIPDMILTGTGAGGNAPPLALLFNDDVEAQRVLSEYRANLAAVIIEPVAHRFGIVAEGARFLRLLRNECDRHGILLIFDETVTALRVSSCGAAQRDGVIPDLTLLGPSLTSGLPFGVVGGRRELVEQIASACGANLPPGEVGNPLATAAALATLQVTGEPGFYESWELRSARLADGLRRASARASVAAHHARIGSFVGMYLANDTGRSSSGSGRADLFRCFYEAMLERGVLWPAHPLTSLYVSSAHTQEQIDQTIAATQDALKAIRVDL